MLFKALKNGFCSEYGWFNFINIIYTLVKADHEIFLSIERIINKVYISIIFQKIHE